MHETTEQIVTLFKQNDNSIVWDEMQDASGNFLNSATVTMTLKDSNSNPVTGATNVPLTYVSGSNGRYQGAISSNVGLVVGASYTLELTAFQGDKDAFRKLTVQVLERTT